MKGVEFLGCPTVLFLACSFTDFFVFFCARNTFKETVAMFYTRGRTDLSDLRQVQLCFLMVYCLKFILFWNFTCFQWLIRVLLGHKMKKYFTQDLFIHRMKISMHVHHPGCKNQIPLRFIHFLHPRLFPPPEFRRRLRWAHKHFCSLLNNEAHTMIVDTFLM